MKVLVLGHPLVVDVNREVWSHLADEEVQVDMVVPKSWQSNLIKEMKYEPSVLDKKIHKVFPLRCFFKGNGSLYFFSPSSLYQVLAKNKYDKIILTQETWSLSLAALWILKKFTKNRKTQIFLWVCQNIKKQKFYFLRYFERIINQDVQRILGCCTETMDVVDWKGIKAEKYYLPFSIAQERFQLLDKPKNIINIGYIGRISEEKGIDEIIKVSQRLRDDDGIKFHIAGAGNWEAKVQAQKHIKFHGVLKHREVFEFYKDMHIILLPSHTKEFWKEQFGRVIVEGAATGSLVVGSNSGAIPEVMGIVGFSNFIFKEGNVDDFEEKLISAIEYVKSGQDTSLFAAKAIEKFSHESVANLLKGYLLNSSSHIGEIPRVGEINGYL